MCYFRYFWTVVKHKWFILLCLPKAGWQMLPRFLVHDLSKFLPNEFIPSARYWGKRPEDRTETDKKGFLKAKELHEKRNKHHYEHWFRPFGEGEGHPYLVPMDGLSIIEMMADWRAAGLAYKGVDDAQDYFIREGPRMTLHEGTRAEVEDFLNVKWNPKKGVYQKWPQGITWEDFE